MYIKASAFPTIFAEDGIESNFFNTIIKPKVNIRGKRNWLPLLINYSNEVP